MKPTAQFLYVIGCSAGGFEALKSLLPSISARTRSAFAIVLHISQASDADLPALFAAYSNLLVKEAEDKEPIQPGTIYIAPAGYHLLVESDWSFSLSVDEPVQFSRPSIDVFFESAALALKQKVMAIVLSGANSDGARGLQKILACGGAAIVENPKTALHPTMPATAIELNARAPKLSVLSLSEVRDWLAGRTGSKSPEVRN